MKRRTGISLMMALLMIVSTFAVITPSVLASRCGLYVEKTVWNGEGWVEEIDAVFGDTVEFKITITYYNQTNCASNIVVTDYLPAGLKYEETLEPEEPEPEVTGNTTGNTLVWDFGEEQLCHGDSITIRFEAVVVGGKGNYGENVNTVNVTAEELCGPNELFDEDTATVIINPSVDVDKKVRDPDAQEWVEHLDSVIKDVDVQFQITITYYGPDIITCANVIDTFITEGECDGCLEYIEGSAVFSYPNEHFEHPEIIVDGKSVEFSWWTDKLFNLQDGESVVITFDANVTNYCYESIVTNEAVVEVKNCDCNEGLLEGSDTATVNCRPHDPVFEKTVWNGEAWAKETNAYIDDIVEFKIELTYYGSYNLSDIQVVDELPEKILTYVGESGESEDNKIIRWNIIDALNDGETLVIKVEALVIGDTGDCDCGINTASYNAVESVTEFEYDGEDTAKVITSEKIVVELGLAISIKPFSIGRVNACIENVGEVDLSDINWTISATKAGLLGFTKSACGKIKTLAVDNSKTISTYTNFRSRIVRRFGPVVVKVTATVGEETFESTFYGLIIGRLFIDMTVRAL